MKRIVEEFRKDDERVLDRLVDGELAPEDRKALLNNLDDEPGAWRRCALAFLEAQAWRSDFLPVSEAPVPQPDHAPVPANSPLPPRPSRFFELCLAIAACVVMAFGVGVWVRSMWVPPGSNSRRIDFASGESRSPGPPSTTVASPQAPWRAKLRYDDPATPGADDIELPVVEAENLSKDWLRQNSSAFPEDVKQALEQSGHRVIQQRQLLPIPLNDGGQLLVPVEQVDLQPRARPAY